MLFFNSWSVLSKPSKNPVVNDLLHPVRETLTFMTFSLNNVLKNPWKVLVHCCFSPLVLSTLFAMFFGYLNGVMITFAQEYQRQWHRQHPTIIEREFVLDDFLFNVFEFQNLIDFAGNYLSCLVAFMLIRFFFTPQRFVIIRRFLALLGVMFILRSLAVYISLLNDPSQNKSNVVGNPFFEGAHVATGNHVSTVDKMFSGHTCALTLAALFLIHYWDSAPLTDRRQYAKVKSIISSVFKFGILLYLIGGLCLFALVRIHYTADIFIGAVLSILVFYWYHNYMLLSSTKNCLLDKLICWLEQDATDIPKIHMAKIQHKVNTTKETYYRIIQEEKEKRIRYTFGNYQFSV
ncbi:Sphingomyelin synthase-like domain-containing protein [Entamoeba marina]